jgi:hypothetical protein
MFRDAGGSMYKLAPLVVKRIRYGMFWISHE